MKDRAMKDRAMKDRAIKDGNSTNHQSGAVEALHVMPHVMPRCPACGQPEQLVWVHGHGQCAPCHMNVMPCCDGAVCETD